MDQLVDVGVVWVEEYYDGTLTGLAEYQGKTYWFTPLDEDWYKEGPRRLALRRLSESDAAFMSQRIQDSRNMTAEEYWPKYHPTDRDELGYQAHDGEIIGWFVAS